MNARSSNDYVIRVFDDPSKLDARAWNALLDAQAQPTLFMRHEYLAALHASGSAVPRTGWTPRFVTLWSHGRLAAAAPAYIKAHSFGEYVFDWAWADAYARHGLDYYPKLLVAVPFTPVPGTRLLAEDDAAREALVAALRRIERDEALSSAHVLFHDEADAAALASAGWMTRQTVQFHWRAADAGEPSDFEAFLARLQRDKRKKIHQERRRVAEAGVTFRVLQQREIDKAAWDLFYRCYVRTYRAHRSTPYLTRAFFGAMAAAPPQHWVMFVAERGGAAIAASLIAWDAARRAAYGRYWGALEQVDCLHFEACYYQPLQWCIAHGVRTFEGGAQGEHKMARGLLPVRMRSAHRLAHPAFAQAVDDHLRAEGLGVDAYVDELAERDPFKRSG
ncbi:MAG: peptidogalycan biosysnthesis protein [Burkholderiaceae bacterium]